MKKQDEHHESVNDGSFNFKRSVSLLPVMRKQTRNTNRLNSCKDVSTFMNCRLMSIGNDE